MEIIAFFLVFLFLMMLINNTPNGKKQQPDKLVVQKKRCPPHAWKWQAIVDQDGNKIAECIVCDHCGPLTASESLKDGI